MGTETLLVINANGIDLRVRLDGRNHPEAGARIEFAIDPGELHLFDAASGATLRR
jgi:hypothetical protein